MEAPRQSPKRLMCAHGMDHQAHTSPQRRRPAAPLKQQQTPEKSKIIHAFYIFNAVLSGGIPVRGSGAKLCSRWGVHTPLRWRTVPATESGGKRRISQELRLFFETNAFNLQNIESIMRELRLLAAILCGFPLVSGPGLPDGGAAAIPIKSNCRCCCCHGALSAAAAQQRHGEARRAAERAEGEKFNFATFPRESLGPPQPGPQES